jgi:hypothetical protein
MAAGLRLTLARHRVAGRFSEHGEHGPNEVLATSRVLP